MRLIHYLFLFFLCLVGLFMLLFASCEHKELCYDHSHTVDVQVIFDWEKVPDADPTSVRLYLFPLNGGSVLSYEFTDSHRGEIAVPSGCYRALCVNSDTHSILYRNISRFIDFEAYTVGDILKVRSSSAPCAEGTEEQRIARSPERFWCARTDEVCIEKSGKHLTFYMEEATVRYRVRINHVNNLKYIESDGISGALSGMSGSLFIGQGIPSSEVVNVPFGIASEDSAALTAEFFGFGCPPLSDKPHKLVVYVLLADGSKCYYTYEVTSQIHEAENPRDVLITVDSLRLPKPITNGGGFHPDVDEWRNEEIEISM